MEPYRLATEIAMEDPHTIVFRACIELAHDNLKQWSSPVQWKFTQNTDGTYDVILRNVNLRTFEEATT